MLGLASGVLAVPALKNCATLSAGCRFWRRRGPVEAVGWFSTGDFPRRVGLMTSGPTRVPYRSIDGVTGEGAGAASKADAVVMSLARISLTGTVGLHI